MKILTVQPKSLSQQESNSPKRVLPNLRFKAIRNFSPLTSPGFTLIELLIVITLIGIVAGFMLPGLFGMYQHQQLDNTTNQIITDIKKTRSYALSNYQGEYSVAPPDGPVSDCDPTPSKNYTYIEKYRFSFESFDNRTDDDGSVLYDGYTITPVPRTESLNGDACPTVNPKPLVTYHFPAQVVIRANDITYDVQTTPVITYNTVSGKSTLDEGGSIGIILTSKAYNQTITKQLCITYNKFDTIDACQSGT